MKEISATLKRVYRVEAVVIVPGSRSRVAKASYSSQSCSVTSLTPVRESSERLASPWKVASMSRVESRQPAREVGRSQIGVCLRTSNPRSFPCFLYETGTMPSAAGRGS